MKQEMLLRIGFAFLIVVSVTFLSLTIIGIRNNRNNLTADKKKILQDFLKKLIKNVVVSGVWLFFQTRKWLQKLQKWKQQRRQCQKENENVLISKWWLALPAFAVCFFCFTLGCLLTEFRYYHCNETFTSASNRVYAKEITLKAGTTPTPTAPTADSSVKAKAEGTKTTEKEKEVTVKTLFKTKIYDKHYHDAEIIGEIPKGQNLKILKNEYGFLYTSFQGISGFIHFEDTNYTEVMGIKNPSVDTYSSIVKGHISNETFLLSKPLKHSKKLATLEKGVSIQFLGYASWFFGSDGYDMVMLTKTGKIGYVPCEDTYTYTTYNLPSYCDNTAKKAADGGNLSSSKDSTLKKMSSSNDNTNDAISKKAADKKNSSSDDGGNDNTSKKATDTKKPSSDDSSSDGTSKKAANKKNSSSDDGDDDNTSKKATDTKRPSSNTGSGGSSGKKSSSNTGSGGSSGKKSKTAFGITLDLYKKYNVCQEPLNKGMGVKSFNGHIETYYSERKAPGGGLNIPGRHSGEKAKKGYGFTKDGTVRDKYGYIVLASHNKYIPKGTIMLTSLGPGKVYDCCACTDHNPKKQIDIYVSW